jgi:transposase
MVRVPRLSPEQEAQVAAWVEAGPELEHDGVVRWRCRDLRDRIRQQFAVELHERTVGKLLRKLSLRPRSAITRSVGPGAGDGDPPVAGRPTLSVLILHYSE